MRNPAARASESAECQALVSWWDAQCSVWGLNQDDLIHIPNEGRRSERAGARLKREGMRPGASDYLLAVPRGGYHGFWIEMKRRGEKPTASQVSFLTRRQCAGYAAEWFDDWECAREAIQDYLRARGYRHGVDWQAKAHEALRKAKCGST